MQDRLFYIGQKALINKDDKVLILHDPDIDKIDLPGGKIQEGETDFNKALQREVFEETGLIIQVGKPFATSYFEFATNSGHRNKGKQIYLVNFYCEYISGEVRLSNEHDWYKWVDKNDFKKFIHQGNIYDIVENYFKLSKDLTKTKNNVEDPLLNEVYDYLTKFDFPVAQLIQRKFKIGFSRAEKILKQIEIRKNYEK